jgi:hypothetical protein
MNCYHSHAGIYALTCLDCLEPYIGQTGITMYARHKEHIRSNRYNKDNSNIALHILNNRHSYGTVEQVMETISYTGER